MALRVGDDVEVYSNSQKNWLPGTVQDVLAADGDVEGYRFDKGSIKVHSAAGSKWIPQAQIAAVVRAAAKSKTDSPSGYGGPMLRGVSGASCGTSTIGLCRHGCGRAVQPGLTRGAKKYDTCCKACSQNPGKGVHDPNCGGGDGAAGGGEPVVSLSFTGPSPRQWLADLLKTEAKLKSHVDQVYQQAGGGSQLNLAQMQKAVNEILLEPIHTKLNFTEASLQSVAGSSTVDQKGFLKVCRLVIDDRQKQYFPEKISSNTSHFVCKQPGKSKEVYEFHKKLGEGSYGTVFAVTHKVSGENRVCKSISTNAGSATMTMPEILGEIQNMAMMDHPNVIKVYEYFEEGEKVLQILELCQGGELQDRIDEVFRKRSKPRYSEEFMCDVMKQVLRALAFMHSQRYMHKDLKPQNIMMVDQESSSIKVIDFGLAELFGKDQKTTKNWGGTLLYMAPEVFKQELAFKSDIWGAGVILYNLLTGGFPFIGTWPLPQGKDIEWWENETEKIIKDERRDYAPNSGLQNVSPACLDMLNKMLIKDVRKRPDAPGCLSHDWFRQFTKDLPPLSVGLSQCLQAYAGAPELKKTLFLWMAHQSTAPAVQELRAIFTQFDTSNRGSLSNDTVTDMLKRSGQSRLTVESTVHALDRDSTGSVQWTEFLAAALCIAFIGGSQKRLVEAAFFNLDKKSKKAIGNEEFLQVFAHSAVPQPVRAIWSKLLPDEIGKIRRDGEKIAVDVFTEYMCRRMNTAAGDSLQAVQK